MTWNGRWREAGFSLVELLVSLAVMGLMASLLLSGLVTGRRAWDRVDQRTRASEDVAAAQSLLRTLIRRLYPQGSLRGSRPFVQFFGDEHRMLFQSAPTDAEAPAPPRFYRLSLSAGGALMLESRHGTARDPDRMTDSATITRDVRSVEFSYFGRALPDGQPRWRPRWQDQPVPPQAIRVRLTYAPGDRRRWPELIAQPAATIDTLCVYAISNGRCRGRS